MNVMIHACPARMWYVERFPAPSLRVQGIELLIFCDTERRGNLGAFPASIRELHGDGEVLPRRSGRLSRERQRAKTRTRSETPLAVW